ncbi:MAG: hypothetical protein RR454_03130 [Clostridia bacterium]
MQLKFKSEVLEANKALLETQKQELSSKIEQAVCCILDEEMQAICRNSLNAKYGEKLKANENEIDLMEKLSNLKDISFLKNYFDIINEEEINGEIEDID